MERTVDAVIIGAGSAGLYALPQIRRKTERFLIVNSGHHGTTCARVGCMPSKGLIQAAEDLHRGTLLDGLGLRGGEGLKADLPAVLRRVRAMRDGFVKRVMGGAIEKLGDHCLNGHAYIRSPDRIEINGETIRTKAIIIATGSTPFIPDAWQRFRPYLITTDEIFEQEDLPSAMAVLGLGAIGLELGQALARLGISVAGFDLAPSIGGLKDPEVAAAAMRLIGAEFPLTLGAPIELAEENGQLVVRAAETEVRVGKALCAAGRVPNLEGLGIENLGLPLDRRGLPPWNPNTMQVGDLPVYIAGDVNAAHPLLHEAADDGRIAGFNALAEAPTAFTRKTPLMVAFCEPNLVSVGKRWTELEPEETAVGSFDFSMQGRAMLMAKAAGLLRVYARKEDGLLLGAEMAAPHGEHLGHLLAWCIEQNLTLDDLLKMPFYHPVLEEGLQNALYAARAQCVQHDQPYPVELRPMV